jgi:DNA-binding CsgD family transcriptional regulator
MMAKADDFFTFQNRITEVSDEEYKAVNILVHSFDSISRLTYKSMYVIDYFKKNFLCISSNPLFLCGYTREEVMKMGYEFYIKQVPEDEQEMLVEINNAGFSFFNSVPADERLLYTISYDFNILNGTKKMLLHHKITPIILDREGKAWLVLCFVSLSSRKNVGNVEMRKAGQTSYWKYSFKTKQWTKNAGISLKDTEKAILFLSARGYTIEEIADKINRTVATVKFHRKNLYDTLQVNNIAKALMQAINDKLI